jgi:hypothetical protein
LETIMQRALATLGFLALFAVSLAALSAVRVRDHEEQLGSDEPEWIAISILNWNQLVHGAPPAGAELKPPEPGEGPWELGVQGTTFGYMNPCLPKLVWGGVLAAAGHTQASPYAFQSFYKLEPREQGPAWLALRAPMPLTRRVVLVLAALSGALLFCVARSAVGGGRAGWWAGGAALALWIASPLVQRTATYIRTDHFMLPFVLALWWWTLARREALAGALGTRPALVAGAVAGGLGGLATSSKLNGALALVAFGLAALLLWLARPPEAWPRPPLGRVLGAVALAAAVSFGVFWLLNPRLWSGPIEGLQDVLARWDRLMGFFQDEWAPRTGVAVAHTRGESVALFVERTLARDEPLAAHGLPGGALWIVLGLAALAACALGRGPLAHAAAAARGTAAVSLVFVLALTLGTALWLPLDWERLFLPAVPALAIAGAFLVASAAAALLGRRNAGGPGD